MLATWILCLFIMMIIPYLTVEAGVLRWKKCDELGEGRGYRSALARSSQEAWTCAQRLCRVRYIVTGALMAIITLIIASFAPVSTPSAGLIFTLAIVLFQVAVIVCLIASVECGLRKRFAGKKN